MQRSTFEKKHPWVVFCYVMSVLVITMITMHPVMIGVSFVAALIYSFFLCGKKVGKMMFAAALGIGFFSMVILPLFHHSGETPLFYINDMAVTKESVIYGGVMTLLLLAVLLWFLVWNELMGQEKWLYLIGRAMPSIALIVSMVLRLLPLLRHRLQDIAEAQKGLQAQEPVSERGGRLRHFIGKKGVSGLHQLSILISWSLEDSMETATSMETRGYGIRRRSSFHLYQFHRSDAIWLVYLLVVSGEVLVFVARGAVSSAYFPMIEWKSGTVETLLCQLGFALLTVTPCAYDILQAVWERHRRNAVREQAYEQKEQAYLEQMYGVHK